MDEILRHPLSSAALIALAIVVGAMLVRRPLRKWADTIAILRDQIESVDAQVEKIVPKVREMDRFLTVEFGPDATSRPRSGQPGDETALLPRQNVAYGPIDRSRLNPNSPDPQYRHFTVREVMTALDAGIDPSDPGNRGLIAVAVSKLQELQAAATMYPVGGHGNEDSTQIFTPPPPDDSTAIQPVYRDSEPPTQYQ